MALTAVHALAATCVIEPSRVEVVTDAKACPSVVFAAEEMTNFLSRVLGAHVPLVHRPSAGKVVSIVLGDNEWSRAAGIDVGALAQDEYVTRVERKAIYLAGRDDPFKGFNWALNKGGYAHLMRHDKATLFAVYGFLEKNAGVRFYLPEDELGVITPRRGRIEIAEGETRVKPDFLIREPYMGGDGSWYCERDEKDRTRIKSLEWLRLRMSVAAIPCCHGSRWFKYIERFGASHPEYLRLRPDGTRGLNPNVFAAYQLCWSNPGFQETLYEDVKAYLTGKSASSRGLRNWGNNCRDGRYVDIMPDDAYQKCSCPGCTAAYRKDDAQYATELVWGVAVKIAQRLQDEGVAGDITMMSYTPYGRIPDFALPTNIQVMVAKTGPWALVNPKKAAEDESLLRAWTEKLGRKVWIWTYPHKFSATAIPGVPCMAPHAWGRYFKRVSPLVFGTFAECESDRAIYNHLNYYVFSRVAWDAKTDVDHVIGEYHDLMFGPGAEDMKRLYRILERKWLFDVAGRVEDTALGPVAKAPSSYQLWRGIYTPELRRQLRRLIDSAKTKTAPDSLEYRRIGLMSRELVDPLVAAAEAWERETDVRAALERRARETNRSILPPFTDKAWSGKFEIDTNDCVSAAGSVHFRASHTACVRTSLIGRKSLPDLKPDTRYRLSYFVKTRDVKPIKIPGGTSGGVSVNVWDDRNLWFPSPYTTPGKTSFSGTMDWIYQEFEFKTGPLTGNLDPAKGRVNRSYLQLHILYASGEAWFDDVRLEEL